MDRISFGKYRGKGFDMLPEDYLQWMVRNDTQQADKAETELKRRAAGGIVKPESEVVIMPDAIDSASILIPRLWQSHPKGIVKWLEETWVQILNTKPKVQMHFNSATYVDYMDVRWYLDANQNLLDLTPLESYYHV